MSRTYYCHDEPKTQRLTAEEERELFKRFEVDRSNPKVREEVVRAYIGFALMKAKRDIAWRKGTTNNGAFLSEDDAISAANFGLMSAIDRFSLAKGCRFTTYAGWWVEKYLREARFDGHTVSLSYTDRAKITPFNKLARKGASDEDIAELHNTTAAEVRRILDLNGGRCVELPQEDRSAVVSDDDTDSDFSSGPAEETALRARGGTYVYDESISGDEALAASELQTALAEACKKLGAKEISLLHDRFTRKMTVRQIAEKNKLSVRAVEDRLRILLSTLRLYLKPYA